MGKIPQPTVPLGMHGLSVYRLLAKEPACADFNRAEWHLLAETAHLVELAASTDSVRVYAEVRQRLRALRLTETSLNKAPTATSVGSFNALRNRGRSGADPRAIRPA